jgi:hypothetical protein
MGSMEVIPWYYYYFFGALKPVSYLMHNTPLPILAGNPRQPILIGFN